MADNFTFFDPGKLIDDELELVLVEKIPVQPEKKYDPSYRFEMRNTTTKELMGYVHLRINYKYNLYYAGNIGYGVDEKYRGHHYAARASKLLFNLARKHGLKEVWLSCNPDNLASRHTIESIGGKLIEVVDLPEDNEMRIKNGETKKCRYKIDL